MMVSQSNVDTVDGECNAADIATPEGEREQPQEAASATFDFKAHEQAAISDYLKRYSFFQQYASVMKQIVDAAIGHRGIRVHSVQGRAKHPTSVGAKAVTPDEEDPRRPKYAAPLQQITDLAGVRVITYFPGTLADIDTILREEYSWSNVQTKAQNSLMKNDLGIRVSITW